jgi:hypothetical protein
MSARARILLVAVIGTVPACGRPPLLAAGPIDLSERPVTVRFLEPVSSDGRSWELCFEFDPPGDSHRAAQIHTTLVSSSGHRAAVSTPTLDRRGESIVCQLGHRVPPEPGAEGVRYESAELRSDVALRVRAIRGGSRP